MHPTFKVIYRSQSLFCNWNLTEQMFAIHCEESEIHLLGYYMVFPPTLRLASHVNVLKSWQKIISSHIQPHETLPVGASSNAAAQLTNIPDFAI